MTTKLALILSLFLGISSQAYACDIEDVVLVDKENCKALEKIIGTEYQCATFTPTSIVLTSFNKPEKEVRLEDDNLYVLPSKMFYNLKSVEDLK